MAQYEYQYGDFLAAQKIFSRYSEAFPEESPINRFASRHGYVGLDEIISIDLGTSITSNLPQQSQQQQNNVQQERQSGSQSPLSHDQQSRNKRGPSVEPPRGNYDRAASIEPYNAGSLLGGGGGGEDYGSKRPKFAHEASPAPSNENGGWNNRIPAPRDEAPVRESRGYRGGFAGPRADEEPEYAMSRRAAPPPRERIPGRIAYALDPRTDVSSPLPDAVVFFLSILPGAVSFNGSFYFTSLYFFIFLPFSRLNSFTNLIFSE